jgi:hypothetical protein
VTLALVLAGLVLEFVDPDLTGLGIDRQIDAARLCSVIDGELAGEVRRLALASS